MSRGLKPGGFIVRTSKLQHNSASARTGSPEEQEDGRSVQESQWRPRDRGRNRRRKGKSGNLFAFFFTFPEAFVKVSAH